MDISNQAIRIPSPPPVTISNTSNSSTSSNHIYSYPGLSRLFYLPPGQPGATAVTFDIANWVKLLSTNAWIPAVSPGASVTDVASLVLKPCEVLLPFHNNNHNNSNNASNPTVTSNFRRHTNASSTNYTNATSSVSSHILPGKQISFSYHIIFRV